MKGLEQLQHERNWNQCEAWINGWEEITNDQAKVNFLAMLKARRDEHHDQIAAFALFHLTTKWLHEPYLP